jgi:hypothetical protein
MLIFKPHADVAQFATNIQRDVCHATGRQVRLRLREDSRLSRSRTLVACF